MKQIISAFSRLNSGKRTFAVLLLFATTAISLPAQIFTVLHGFQITDGKWPTAGLVQAANGDFYGTTSSSGGGRCMPTGCGTVFKITPSGALTTLHTFDVTDGSGPQGLVLANSGLYGVTYAGGANSLGTVFKIAADGTLTTLHSFNSIDGSAPTTLVQANNGEFYGTTQGGGANRLCVFGRCGTLFKITPNGVLTTLYSFCSQANCTDGEDPNAGLIQAADGNFYGTTTYGGSNQSCVLGGAPVGCGTVFKITPNGVLTTLYSFCSQSGCADGEIPDAGLVQASDGNFYGTTDRGGVHNSCPFISGCGTVFKITPSGALTTLHSLDDADGSYPEAPLIQASDGNFYGTTTYGGASFIGTIFKITSTGKLTTLHSFGSTGGYSPQAPLVEARNGSFYGTTFYGPGNIDPNNNGTVFTLEVFVKALPTFGEEGTAVKILGTNLTGATSVTFNGVAAVFQVVSPTEITTTVPPGASTGEVEVMTPGGTLSSIRPFRVQ
jgi:uncharacterized repeat protein (TIGR03803 family)